MQVRNVRTDQGITYVIEYMAGESPRHNDLRQEAAQAALNTWEYYVITPLTLGGYRTGPPSEMLWLPAWGRAGLACGGDAVWTDADTPLDAVERYLGIDGKAMAS